MNPVGNKVLNVNANGTVSIPGRFVLQRIVVNTKAGSGGTAVIYDSTEAIGANAQRRKGTLDTVNTLGNVEYGIPCYDGIYIVVGGGTTPDLTIVYSEF